MILLHSSALTKEHVFLPFLGKSEEGERRRRKVEEERKTISEGKRESRGWRKGKRREGRRGYHMTKR